MRLKVSIKSWFAANKIGIMLGDKQKRTAAAAAEDEHHEAMYHKLTLAEIAVLFDTSLTTGLTESCAQQLLIKNGQNRIKPKSKNIFWRLVSYLFTGFCGLLWISSLICLLAWKPIGNPPDPTNLGLCILLIIVILLQASFSAFQDWSSDKVMKSIKSLIPSQATVIRDNAEHTIAAEDLVLGDLVILEYGHKVPADVRIIDSHDLKFDRALLTGESESVDGTVECTDEQYVQSKNIAFMTTLITNGQGKGVVVSTGKSTMIGKIASLANHTNQKESSLQKEIRRFVIFICLLAITTVVILLIFWGAYIRPHYPLYIDVPTMMVNCIAVMVAFIPTGLPVAVTLSLLLIARKMAKCRVLVKNLSTIETLSCVNVIASDKTGTLTQNKMFVSNVAAGMEKFVNRKLGSAAEEASSDPAKTKQATVAFDQLVLSTLLCNNSHFVDEEENMHRVINQRSATGDATDIALLKFASHHLASERAENFIETLSVPFNSRNKWMMKTFQLLDQDLSYMYLKGAPDRLLAKCSTIINEAGVAVPVDNKTSLSIIEMQNDWCIRGQRVILLCRKELDAQQSAKLLARSQTEIETYVNESDDFCFVGMIGIIDPPREGISNVIGKCREAGIRVLMITGDYALTAAAIATEIGIFTNQHFDTIESVHEKLKQLHMAAESGIHEKCRLEKKLKCSSLLLTGSDLVHVKEAEWRLITKYDEIVFARTSPEQKLLIVKEFQRDKYVVGVTGDGVNDAPALKSADIGIAMGSGSEVAMEASQLVLLDSNFSSMLIAIENGRLVFDNLRKVILYLLPAGSIGEIFPILVNIFFGVPLPLSAFLMICICILTDMFPALALMFEKPEKDLLKKPPRDKNQHLVDWKLIIQAYLFIGLFEGFFSHFVFFMYLIWYGGFHISEIFFAYDKWGANYKGHSKAQLDELVFTGQTLVFVCLVIIQAFGNVFATRTNYQSLFTRPPFLKKGRNLWIFAAQLITVILMVLIVFIPFINNVFNTRPIPLQFFFIPLLFALLLILLDELRKLLVRRNWLCFAQFAW